MITTYVKWYRVSLIFKLGSLGVTKVNYNFNAQVSWADSDAFCFFRRYDADVSPSRSCGQVCICTWLYCLRLIVCAELSKLVIKSLHMQIYVHSSKLFVVIFTIHDSNLKYLYCRKYGRNAEAEYDAALLPF